MVKERNPLVEQIIFKNNKGLMDKDKKGNNIKKGRKKSKKDLKNYKGDNNGQED